MKCKETYKTNQPLVINMSSMQLTEPQISILKKGLKFTPTPKHNQTELETDMKAFCRKIRLKEYFHDKNDKSEGNDNILVRNKSKWNPGANRNPTLDNCIDFLTKAATNPTHEQNKDTKHNISLAEKQALEELHNNQDIIIKQADKGGAVIIMNKDFYASKITEMLNNNTTYNEINNDAIDKSKTQIRNLVDKYNMCLKEEERDYLTNFESRESNLYGLPKIHKSELVKKAIQTQNSEYITILNPEDLAFRPIIAGPISQTSRLSHLVDLLLKDIPRYTQSYVRDDLDFLSKLNRNLSIDEQYLLVTFDVENLYTNIDHELGREAIEYWLSKHRDKVNARFTNSFILDAIKVIQENNTFNFNDKHYIQLNGTAMGTKMAPTYAILVLAYLEEKLYMKLNNEKGVDFSDFIRKNFLRYIDDCFIVWPHSKGDIKEFETELNNIHPKFKFTKETNVKEIPFLDILVYFQNQQLLTTIHYKATDSHQYLPFNSCHPRHTKVSIPYAQARRLCTIIDDISLRDKRLEEMKEFFLARGYPLGLINDGIKKAISIPQQTLRQVQPKSQKDVLPFVFTHNPRNPNLTPLVKSTLNILKQDPHMNDVLQSTTFVPSRRQPPNLGRLLTRAKFTNKVVDGGSFKCNDPRCANCKYINETKVLRITSTGKTFEIKPRLTCKSSNILYAITCNGCNQQYVGMTSNTLAKRFTIHRQQMNNPQYRKIGVSKHLYECSSKSIKFTVTPFFKIPDDKIKGQAKEEMFIKTFKPALNKLNLETC